MNYTILVNKENPIKQKYFNYLELIDTTDIFENNIQVEKETFTSYLKLRDFLKEKEIEIGICTAYIVPDQLKTQISEHHTGLALDITVKVNDKFIAKKDELLKNENILLEIHKYLKDFGFILRYPKNKCEITNHHYAPWHIRYVGNIPAQIIDKNNLTLEEYLSEFSGVLVINKEKDMTSRDVVNIVSKTLGIKKIGHTGTLDPLAEGVLVITIGKATKIGELLTASYKQYQAEALLGIKTTTLDITGTIIETKEVATDIDVESVLQSYKKTYLQEVPAYSAVKVAGKKLYEYARNNEKVALPQKEVTIKEIKLLNKTDNYFTFSCLVSKGCYIRSLIRDIGVSLNNCATMTKLTRTKQGPFSLKDSYTLNEFSQGIFNILSIDQALDYKTIVVEEEEEKKIKNGQIIEDIYNITDKIIFKNKNGKLLGIYEKSVNNKLKTWKNF